MPPEILFLAVRMAGALLLYAFLGLILIWLWRDVRSAQVDSISVPKTQLVLTENQQRYELRPHSEIGRAAGNVIRIEDETISARHARLMFQNGHWWIEDLASRNGTEVNGIPVDEPLVVSYGDQIKLGRVLARLEFNSTSEGEKSVTLSPQNGEAE